MTRRHVLRDLRFEFNVMSEDDGNKPILRVSQATKMMRLQCSLGDQDVRLPRMATSRPSTNSIDEHRRENNADAIDFRSIRDICI